MKFYEYLNIDYNRKELIDFVEKIDSWDVVYRRDNKKFADGVETYRYKQELFNNSEIKRLADIFEISYNQIQITKFSPDFTYNPHRDLERTTCILFPILPVFNYEPIVYHIDGQEIPVYYYGPVATDTRLLHSIKGNGSYRINMQFDLHCTLEESLNYVTKNNIRY